MLNLALDSGSNNSISQVASRFSRIFQDLSKQEVYILRSKLKYLEWKMPWCLVEKCKQTDCFSFYRASLSRLENKLQTVFSLTFYFNAMKRNFTLLFFASAIPLN